MVRHIVWDWNGTLLDDLQIVVGAVNDTLATVGRRPITIEEYGANYTRPVLLFYERLLGRTVPEAEWVAFDEIFHASYRRRVEGASLAADARQALAAAQRAGLSQSLMSMYWHDELLPLVDLFDLAPSFVRVDGLRGDPGDRKQAYLEQHLREVERHLNQQIPPTDVLVIGDALDDAEAAAALGLHCVLYNGGAHAPDRLTATGVPVVDSLVEAVKVGALGESV